MLVIEIFKMGTSLLTELGEEKRSHPHISLLSSSVPLWTPFCPLLQTKADVKLLQYSPSFSQSPGETRSGGDGEKVHLPWRRKSFTGK